MNTKMYALYHKSQELKLQGKCGGVLTHYFMAVPCGEPYVINDAVAYVMKAMGGRVSPDLIAKMFREVTE